jgi:hypothetical protein
MIVLELRAVHKISHQARALRYFDADGVFDCPHRGQSMGKGSDPAGALNKMMRIPWIASLKDHFNTAEHLTGAPGIYDLAAGHLDFDSKVSFDSGNRINCNSLCHMSSSIFKRKIVNRVSVGYISL